MADKLPPLEAAVLEQLARTIGEAATGSQLTSLLAQAGLIDELGPRNTKWKRVMAAFVAEQKAYGRSNRVLKLVKAVLAPARFIGRDREFEAYLEEANQALAFAGYRLGGDGRLGKIKPARTLSEARERASNLKAALVARQVHRDVLCFCRSELVVPNYFHAVFEATKSVAEKVRRLSGLQADGAALVDEAFGMAKGKLPVLAFNGLRDDTEKSEHKGVAMLMKGMFGTFRNVTAHAPKVTWDVSEQDAMDLFTLASFLHRKLDVAVRTKP